MVRESVHTGSVDLGGKRAQYLESIIIMELASDANGTDDVECIHQ